MTKTSRNLLLLAFISALTCTLAYHLDMLGHVAYAFERGKLRADREHLARLDASDIDSVERLSHAFSMIAEVVKPSVVNIEAITLNQQLEQFFGRPVPTQGTGSGVIIDQDGHIVTNHHVVENAKAIPVTLADGRTYRAKLIGTDPKTDIAVIKIDADRLHPATLGDSDLVKVGHLVLAIGSPFMYGHSVSHGIVSALGRTDVKVDIDYQNWIQTDAPINPGNSGGPLINARGEVIGINTAIATESGGHQGVAFAIPANMVRYITDKLKTGKKIVRGYLGVEIKPVDPKTASAYGLDESGGALVGKVGKNTPAERAGLRPEDIVLAVDGNPVVTRENLQQMIAAIEPDTEVDLLIWRDQKRLSVTVKIDPQPAGFSPTGFLNIDRNSTPEGSDDDKKRDEDQISESSGESRDRMRFSKLGFEAATVSPALANRFKLDEDVQNGALITWVDPTSEAYAAGFRRGQVVMRANGRRIRNVRQLEQNLSKDDLRKGVRLTLKRGEDNFLTVLQVR